MRKPSLSKISVALLVVLAVCFLYRFTMVFLETYPAGSDIGLHNSIIHSITPSGNVNFLWNEYHMGGGAQDTFPGYHIFAASLIALTGLPDYVAQGLIAALFSSLIVAVAFLITRMVWNSTAGLVAALLIVVSRYDMEILMWSGYPNIVTLFLIPVAFYLFLAKEKFSKTTCAIAASIVSGAIFLTHVLSAVIFVLITAATALVIIVLPRQIGEKRITALSWISPLILGALAISPFLVQVVPDFLRVDAAVFTGGVAGIQQALLSSRLVPLEYVVAAFVGVFLFIPFSKHYKGKPFTLPTVLLLFWCAIPAALTQAYLAGLYTDFLRFLYFAILPITILGGVIIYHFANYISSGLKWFFTAAKDSVQLEKLKSKIPPRHRLSKRNIAAVFMVVSVIAAFFYVPIFISPREALVIHDYYQSMDAGKYAGIEWAKANTAADAVFLADADYGWWFSGFAQRRTFSGVDPQFLMNSREFESALLVNRLLDTDFLIDNGLVQVRHDGGYTSRHNPEILAKFNSSYYPYTFLNFNSSDITITLRNGLKTEIVKLSDMPVEDMHLENSTDYASIYVTWGNDLFKFTEQTTVYRGSRFVYINYSLATTGSHVSFDTVNLFVQTRGICTTALNSSLITLMDPYAWVAGQLVFPEQQPLITQPSGLQMVGFNMLYNLNCSTNADMGFYVSAFEYPSSLGSAAHMTEGLTQLLEEYGNGYLTKISDNPIDTFSYSHVVTSLNATYVAICDPQQWPRFAKDPLFSCVFANPDVEIYQVQT